MLEAMLLLDEKVPPETIDGAAERFGMPIGPIELADRVGLDIYPAVAETLKAKLDRPMPAVPDWLRRKVEAGELGHKTGKGIYEWKDGKPAKAGAKPAQNTKMTDRLILPMVNVCVACLREGIVEDQDVVDGAMVTGFAPYRGGPLQYARSRGIENVILAQRELTKKFGERFAPDGSRGRPPSGTTATNERSMAKPSASANCGSTTSSDAPSPSTVKRVKYSSG